jgi:uncharacterized membrane protein YkvA (DUF1232 family)
MPDWLPYAIAISPAMALLLGAVLWLLWRRQDAAARGLIKRLGRLPVRSKLRLAMALARDERVPTRVRLLPPLLVLYLALPIDIVPDFIPVAGQLDDVIVILVGIGLLMRFVPPGVFEEHLQRLEAEAREST